MAAKKPVLIILGSGLYNLYRGEIDKTVRVKTEYGEASMFKLKGRGSVYIMLRHGEGHSIPPHMVNYRANIMAAKKMGVAYIIATSAVGSANPSIKAGSYVVWTSS